MCAAGVLDKEIAFHSIEGPFHSMQQMAPGMSELNTVRTQPVDWLICLCIYMCEGERNFFLLLQYFGYGFALQFYPYGVTTWCTFVLTVKCIVICFCETWLLHVLCKSFLCSTVKPKWTHTVLIQMSNIKFVQACYVVFWSWRFSNWLWYRTFNWVG